MSNLAISTHDLQLVDPNLLPPQMRLLVQAIGLPDTLKLLQERGGTFFRFPYKANDSILESIIGLPAAEKLCELYGGKTWELPKADKVMIKLRNIAVQKARETKSASEVALMFDLTRRHVINLCPKDNESINDLFDQEHL